MKKVWNRSQINLMLQSNPKAVERAMVVLFNRQTRDEQSAETTRHHNGIGFCSWAARNGTYYAKWVLKGRRLTGRHMQQARKIALHHSRQLVEEANKKSWGKLIVGKPKIRLSKVEAGVKNEPQPGTWASTARLMAGLGDPAFNWDAWKDQMKEEGL
jgi:hypothetical protein